MNLNGHEHSVSYDKLVEAFKAKGFVTSGQDAGGGNIVLNARKTDTDMQLGLGPLYLEDAGIFGLKSDFYFGEDEMDHEDGDYDHDIVSLRPDLTDTEVDIVDKAIVEYERLNATYSA